VYTALSGFGVTGSRRIGELGARLRSVRRSVSGRIAYASRRRSGGRYALVDQFAFPVPDRNEGFMMVLGVRDVDQALRAHLRGELRRLLQHFLPRKKLTLKGLELHAHNEHPRFYCRTGNVSGGIPSLFRSVHRYGHVGRQSV
jgi:hypothetical protein